MSPSEQSAPTNCLVCCARYQRAPSGWLECLCPRAAAPANCLVCCARYQRAPSGAGLSASAPGQLLLRTAWSVVQGISGLLRGRLECLCLGSCSYGLPGLLRKVSAGFFGAGLSASAPTELSVSGTSEVI